MSVEAIMSERAYAWRNRVGSRFHRVRADDPDLTVCKLRIDGSDWRASNKMPPGREHCGGACFFGASVGELLHGAPLGDSKEKRPDDRGAVDSS